jgi:lipoprotein-anchoring transpeptidase ErfK/SrfK
MGASVQNSLRPRTGHSIYSRYRSNLLASALATTAGIALLAGLATSAQAFQFDWQQRAAPQPVAMPQPEAVRPTPRPPKATTTTTASRDKPAAKDGKDVKDNPEDVAGRAKGQLSIIVSIDKQHLTLYSDGQPIAHSRVSTGQPGHSTPTGVFSVIQKDRWHRSNLYGDAPMFYMQRITWSGVAMHQGIVPNYPASHGCIRLPEAFAKQLWGITRLGVRVIVARGEVTPVAISHAKLFTLKREQPVEPKIDAKLDVKNDARSAQGETSSAIVQAAYSALAELRGKRGETATDAGKPGDPALDAMAYAMGSPRESAATSSEVVRSAYDTFDTGKPRRSRLAISTDPNATDTPVLKPGPISVFISRKEGKLFVRKGFTPVFSVPVSFEQPDRPLGTHVYTALSLKDDNTTMRWNVISMPGAGAAKPEKGKRVEPVGPASNASEALDRVNVPQEALDRISELMSPGASLIISDQGLGPETGVGTDFIVLTR